MRRFSLLIRLYPLLLTALCSAAFAATPFTCIGNAGAPIIVRVEGIAELQGDLVLYCTGGTPTPSGQPIPTADIQISLNTNVTNRLITGSVTDALLLIDEPYPPAGQMIPNNLPVPASPRGFLQNLCGLQSSAVVACPETGTGGSPVPYSTQPNVFIGALNGSASIKWTGIPIDPPGPSSSLVLRLTNIRANASMLGLSSTALPTQVVASISVTGAGAPATLYNPQQALSFIEPGVKVQTSSVPQLTQCIDHNPSLAGGTGTPAFDFNVVVTEGYGQSFKQRGAAVSSDGNASPAVSAQNIPGDNYETETGFYAPLLFPSTSGVGLADFGSRLLLKFTNVGVGTHIFVPTLVRMTVPYLNTLSYPQGPPSPLIGINYAALRLIQSDQFGASGPGFTAVASTNTISGTPVAEVSYTGAAAYATYEVLNADPANFEQAVIPVAVGYRSSIATSIAGTITGSFDFAPAGSAASSVAFADPTAAIPRFAATSGWPAYSVSACGTAAPSNPNPANGATGTPTSPQTLSWQGLPGPIEYDVYFGTSPTPVLAATKLTTASFTTPILQSGTTYYWQVFAKGPSGVSSSPLWSFSTTTPTTLTGSVAHQTPFVAGQTAKFTVTVLNPLATPTTGPITVTDALPSGLTLVSASGLGWTCVASTCTGTATLGSGLPYYPISYVVNVASKGQSNLVNTITITGGGSGSDTILDPVVITPPSTPAALGLFTLTPCRAVDTRAGQNKTGSFGPPSIGASSRRDFPLLSSGCGIPSTAQAYSLNLTAVPQGPLDFLSAWESGQPWPGISNLNSTDGSVIANAAMVPAGAGGAVSVVAGKATDLLIDVNGYFAPPNGQELTFYPVTPCRLADTRAGQGKTGQFGPPNLTAYTNRNFTVANSCGVPPTAQAYSLNMTAQPQGPLGFLSAWPAGQPFPNVSTLNAADGSAIANAAIVPAGTGGAITVLASNPTDLIIDVNGYFAPPGSPGSLHFYAMPPCRVADTRPSQGMTGAFGPPSLAAYGSRDFPIPTSNCGVPLTAQAYSLQVTAVPQGRIDFLASWATGQPFPYVSTLNSPKGVVLANTAIVTAGTNGSITMLAGNPTDVIIDINGYFAP